MFFGEGQQTMAIYAYKKASFSFNIHLPFLLILFAVIICFQTLFFHFNKVNKFQNDIWQFLTFCINCFPCHEKNSFVDHHCSFKGLKKCFAVISLFFSSSLRQLVFSWRRRHRRLVSFFLHLLFTAFLVLNTFWRSF